MVAIKLFFPLALLTGLAQCWKVKEFTWSHNISEFTGHSSKDGRIAWIHDYVAFWDEKVSSGLLEKYGQDLPISVARNNGSVIISDWIDRRVYYDTATEKKLFHERGAMVSQKFRVYNSNDKQQKQKQLNPSLLTRSRRSSSLAANDSDPELFVPLEISFAFKDEVLASYFPLSSYDVQVGVDAADFVASDSDEELETGGGYFGSNDLVRQTILPCASYYESCSSVKVPVTFVPKTVADLGRYFSSPSQWFSSAVKKDVANVTDLPLAVWGDYYTYNVRIALFINGRKVNLLIEAHYNSINDVGNDFASPTYVQSSIKVISDADGGFYPNTIRTLYRIQDIVDEFSKGVCDYKVYGSL